MKHFKYFLDFTEDTVKHFQEDKKFHLESLEETKEMVLKVNEALDSLEEGNEELKKYLLRRKEIWENNLKDNNDEIEKSEKALAHFMPALEVLKKYEQKTKAKIA
jgi:SMC interacting uncharacterized protein involved in chromosome segregation